MSSDSGTTPAPSPSLPDSDLYPAAPAAPDWLAEPACCCPSQPRYRVMLAANGTDAATDLLLCGHHFRVSQARLAELGAWVYDRRNRWVRPAHWGQEDYLLGLVESPDSQHAV